MNHKVTESGIKLLQNESEGPNKRSVKIKVSQAGKEKHISEWHVAADTCFFPSLTTFGDVAQNSRSDTQWFDDFFIMAALHESSSSFTSAWRKHEENLSSSIFKHPPIRTRPDRWDRDLFWSFITNLHTQSTSLDSRTFRIDSGY